MLMYMLSLKHITRIANWPTRPLSLHAARTLGETVAVPVADANPWDLDPVSPPMYRGGFSPADYTLMGGSLDITCDTLISDRAWLSDGVSLLTRRAYDAVETESEEMIDKEISKNADVGASNARP